MAEHLAEDALLELATGRRALVDDPAAEAHLADCPTCGALLRAVLSAPGADDATGATEGLVGRHLGPYRLDGLIGAGGMGGNAGTQALTVTPSVPTHLAFTNAPLALLTTTPCASSRLWRGSRPGPAAPGCSPMARARPSSSSAPTGSPRKPTSSRRTCCS